MSQQDWTKEGDVHVCQLSRGAMGLYIRLFPASSGTGRRRHMAWKVTVPALHLSAQRIGRLDAMTPAAARARAFEECAAALRRRMDMLVDLAAHNGVTL